ncbi:MAG: SDR family oxidoreductase [Bacteroidetes bacterium]|nr:MAG: SDR family oxidoreductase [Bacteroidota bacterium]
MENKVVIITGASSGIGKALAFEFGRQGAKIVLTGRNQATLQEVAQELTAQNINNFPVVGDVAVEEDCKRIVEETFGKYGKIDVLINNAGISMRALFADLDLDVIKQVMDINFYGTLYMTKYALPYITATQGSIVGVSSIAGYRGLPGRTGYSASKFAMQGFLEALRTELLPKKVHVLVACPGFTKSNIRKVALNKDGNVQGESPRDEDKMMTSEEVASHIYKAVKKRKRDLVLTRQGKLTVFLNKWFPTFMDKMVFKTMAKEPDSPFK